VAKLRTVGWLVAVLCVAACTSDPDAPINQTFPIRQMDNFFRQFTGSPGPTPPYTREPGYAPAYPPYATGESRGAWPQPPVNGTVAE
jgi:hypothetical protein